MHSAAFGIAVGIVLIVSNEFSGAGTQQRSWASVSLGLISCDLACRGFGCVSIETVPHLAALW